MQGQLERIAESLNDTFQIAYVTRDLDRAIDTLREMTGIRSFMETGVAQTDLGQGAIGELKAALAYSGSVQYEIIQPISGAVQIFQDSLPTRNGADLAFHHVSYFARNREALETLRPIALAGRDPTIFGEFGEESVYFYVDERPKLGHYVEYQYAEPAFDALIPRN